MKTIVYDQDFEELEIKPREEVERYREMLEREVRSRLAERADRRERPCPGCGSGESRGAFEKSGLEYRECGGCGTVYVSPVPTVDALRSFQRESEAIQFWNDRIWAVTRAVRRRKIHGPLAAWIIESIDRHLPEARTAMDLSWRGRLLVEELLERGAPLRMIAAAGPLSEREFEGFEGDGVELRLLSRDEISESAPFDAVTAFDALPRSADVEELMSTVRASLRAGGLFFLTAVSVDGFDLRVLWERARSVHPPDRMNLFSVDGLERLGARHGFEVLEFSTPGAFDVSAVRRAVLENPQGDYPRFVKTLVLDRGAEALEDLQEFLQHHRLSSYARLALRAT